MTSNQRVALAFSASMALFTSGACQPKSTDSTTPVDEAASLEPCEAKFQATKAYVTFAEPPHDDVFFLGPLAAEEVISSLRATGCDFRPDLPEHAMLVDALKRGALMIATITYIGDLPNSAEVVVNEAKLGYATAPDARSFALRLHRAVALTMADTQQGAQPVTQTWRISSISLRSQ
jgi:hypothetical protein